MLLQLSKTVKQSPKSPQIFENNGTFCADRPFSKNRSETNCQKSFVFNQLVSELQSYILSTTTETEDSKREVRQKSASIVHPFNNNWNLNLSFVVKRDHMASIVHPFNNNWNMGMGKTSASLAIASIVHPFNNNWNLVVVVSCVKRKLQSYILSTTTETSSRLSELHLLLMLQSYILSTTTETPSERTRLS